jgi:hypothetical protein
MSGVPLETCWAFNERWNIKFYYKVASCWLFLLSHTTMHGSVIVKFKEGLGTDQIIIICREGKWNILTFWHRSFTYKF